MTVILPTGLVVKFSLREIDVNWLIFGMRRSIDRSGPKLEVQNGTANSNKLNCRCPMSRVLTMCEGEFHKSAVGRAVLVELFDANGDGAPKSHPNFILKPWILIAGHACPTRWTKLNILCLPIHAWEIDLPNMSVVIWVATENRLQRVLLISIYSMFPSVPNPGPRLLFFLFQVYQVRHSRGRELPNKMDQNPYTLSLILRW
jgi:hypothetical protein